MIALSGPTFILSQEASVISVIIIIICLLSHSYNLICMLWQCIVLQEQTVVAEERQKVNELEPKENLQN